jgi:CheY-like chemotaxis protein
MTTILLIEDSRFLRLANERILTKAGYRVISAADGEDALLQVQRVRPDLILLDMLLPRLGGECVLQALKQDHKMACIPVIVISSLPRSNEAKLKGEGAQVYLEKSALADDGANTLLNVVENTLRHSQTGAHA